MLLCFANRGLGSGLSLTGLGGLGCWWWVLEESVEVAGEVPFQAASGFSGGFSLADAFGDVCPGFGTVPGAGDDDGVERLVELAVTVAAEPVAGVFRRRPRGVPRRLASERGLAAASAWVGPSDIYLCGGDGTDPVLVEQIGSDGCNQFGDGRFQFDYLGGERADPSGYRTHGRFGGGELVDRSGSD